MPANSYLESLLDTEARIIAENGTHAVVAIRVEKLALQRFMQRNSHFLGVLADLMPTPLPDKTR